MPRVEYGAGALTIRDLTLQQNGARITVAGTLPFERASSAGRLDARIVNLQVGDLEPWLPTNEPVRGVVNGTAHVGGSLASPSGTATVTLSDGQIGQMPLRSLGAEVTLKDRAATVGVTLEETASNRLVASGAVHLPAENSGKPLSSSHLDVHVRSTSVELGLFDPLLSAVTGLHGTATVDLDATGTVAEPRITGTAQASAVGFQVAATGVTYQDLDARLRFTGTGATIDRFRLTDGGGHALTATGQLQGLVGVTARSLDVHVATGGLQVLHNRFGDATVEARMQISGSPVSPRVTGTVRLNGGTLQVDSLLARLTANAYATVPEAAAPGAAQPVPPPAVASPAGPALDLAVTLPDNLVLRGRDLRTGSGVTSFGGVNLTVGGSLRLQKPPGGDVRVTGDLRSVRGTYTFQGRRFDLGNDSVVRFRGATPTDPVLDVTARREVAGITASVHVTGAARDPRLTLSSDPPLDQGEVLSLIVFNQPLNQLGTTERVSLGQRAAQLAAGAVTTPIADAVARALNLDVVEIQASGRAPSVTVGNHFGALYVSVRQQVGQNSQNEVVLEYRLTDFLRLVTSLEQGQNVQVDRRTSSTGVDLIFTFTY